MKKLFSLTILVLFVSISFQLNAQINKGGCSDYKNYDKMKKERANLKDKEFFDPIIAYGNTVAEAKYNAKIMVLKTLTGNQMYLDNPRVDSIFAEFAGEVVFLLKDEYEVPKTRKKLVKEGKPKYTCFVYRTKYDPAMIDYLQYHINNFIKYSVVFIINPYILENGDVPTKELYNRALDKFHTKCLEPKYKFDNVIELRMLERTKLNPKPTNYNPAKGFQVYKTGNKYLDFVTSIKENSNRTRQVDIVLSIDTITISKQQNSSEKLVNFHIVGYNTHTATEILIFDSKLSVDATNDYDAVDIALNSVFNRDIDAYMYDMTKRYSSYVRDGILFSIKIADTLMTQNVSLILEQSLLDCKLFADASIHPGMWRNNGQTIGKTYEGRTYLLDPLRLKITIIQMLQNAGLKDFNTDISGSDFIITPNK